MTTPEALTQLVKALMVLKDNGYQVTRQPHFANMEPTLTLAVTVPIQDIYDITDREAAQAVARDDFAPPADKMP